MKLKLVNLWRAETAGGWRSFKTPQGFQTLLQTLVRADIRTIDLALL